VGYRKAALHLAEKAASVSRARIRSQGATVISRNRYNAVLLFCLILDFNSRSLRGREASRNGVAIFAPSSGERKNSADFNRGNESVS